MRVLLDSNVWLAILTTDGSCRQMWRTARKTCCFILSRVILNEIEEKLRLKFRFSARHAQLMTSFVRRQGESVTVTSELNISRDPDDNLILAAAVDGKSSYVVTGDGDLLILERYQDFSIVTVKEFMSILSSTK